MSDFACAIRPAVPSKRAVAAENHDHVDQPGKLVPVRRPRSGAVAPADLASDAVSGSNTGSMLSCFEPRRDLLEVTRRALEPRLGHDADADRLAARRARPLEECRKELAVAGIASDGRFRHRYAVQSYLSGCAGQPPRRPAPAPPDRGRRLSCRLLRDRPRTAVSRARRRLRRLAAAGGTRGKM